MNIDQAYDFCRRVAHKHGANFSVGFRFLPKVKRHAVYAAYAYCRFADDIADEVEFLGSSEYLGVPRRNALTCHSEPAKPWRGEARRRIPRLQRDSRSAGDPSPSSAPHARTATPGAPAAQDDSASSPEELRGTPRSSEELRLGRLDHWQRELDAAYAGTPSHAITIALADALQHFAIPKSAFVALIDGCRQDMVKTRYETFDELLHYCDLVATSISDISLSIFGYRSAAAPVHGRNLSTALQLTNITRDIGDDVSRDRIYIPAEELRRFGVTERDVIERVENDRMRRLIEFQIDRAESYFRAAEPLLGELAFDARFPVLLMGGVYATVLAKLRKDPLAAVRTRISLSALQKVLVVGSRVLRPHFV